MIAALVLAAVWNIGLDALAAFGALCLASILIAVTWAFLFRRRRDHHKNTRGYL